MFLEVLRVERGGQTRRCYGSFKTEEARNQFKEGMESSIAELKNQRFFSKFYDANFYDANKIKYIFCEFLPQGRWDKYPTTAEGVFLWVENETGPCFRVPPKYR